MQSELNQIEQPTGRLNQIQNSLSGIDIREYWHVFLRHKWRIIGLAIVITLISGLKVFSEVPIYRSTAKLLIEREGARYVDVKDVYSSNYDWEYYQTQYEILKSRPIAERVVNKLKLDKAPEKKESKPKTSLLDWKKWLPDDWFKKPKEVTQLQRHISTVGFVKGGIQVEPVRNSHLVKISFEGASPQQITSIVNAIAEAYIEETLEGRLAMTQKATSWLTERMSGLREKLDESERKLQAYKDREKVIDTQGDSQLASQEIQILTTQLGKARQDLVAKKELRSKLRQANGSTQKLIKMPALLAHPLVQSFHAKLISAQQKERELGKTYGPLHPKMISAKSEREQAENALSSQLSAAAKSIESEYRIAQEQVDQLRARLNQAKTSAMTVDRKQFQLESLKRDVEANRQLYEQFQQRFKENNATGGVQSANARLLEPALVPNTPIRPNKRRTVMVSLILGLMAGFGLALLLEHLDNTIKGAEDIEKRLGIPMLGMLPLLDVTDKKDLSPMRHFSDNNRSSFSEAVRTIRTGVLLSALDDPHKVILVTSSVPGEGKTTLSMNLSYALGHMKKVLLIDADMRRPMVGKASKTEKTALGLSQ
ncbi:MAG: GumC family protein, partial [bacterium]